MQNPAKLHVSTEDKTQHRLISCSIAKHGTEGAHTAASLHGMPKQSHWGLTFSPNPQCLHKELVRDTKQRHQPTGEQPTLNKCKTPSYVSPNGEWLLIIYNRPSLRVMLFPTDSFSREEASVKNGLVSTPWANCSCSHSGSAKAH